MISYYRSRKQFRFYQRFRRLSIPWTLRNVPCALNELLASHFSRRIQWDWPILQGLFQRMANWRSFDKKIKSGRIIRNRRPVSCNSPCFDRKIETEPVGHPFELRACKICQSHQIPLENEPISSSLRQEGTFFNVPGRKKSCEKSVEKILVRFLERQQQSALHAIYLSCVTYRTFVYEYVRIAHFIKS